MKLKMGMMLKSCDTVIVIKIQSRNKNNLLQIYEER